MFCLCFLYIFSFETVGAAPYAEGDSSTASIMVTRRAGEPVAVNALVDCPGALSIPDYPGCGAGFLTLSAARSSGRLGDAPLTFRWSAPNHASFSTAAQRTKAAALDAWLKAQNSTALSVSIPYSLLVKQTCADPSSRYCAGSLHEFSVVVFNKPGHVFNDASADINAQRATCTTNLYTANQGFAVAWVSPALPPFKTTSLSAVSASVDASWSSCLRSRANATTVAITWSVTPSADDDAVVGYARVVGWATATGLHPDVVSQEAKLAGLVAAERSFTLNLPKNLVFAGRKYHFHASVAVTYDGALLGSFQLDRTMRTEYSTMFSVVMGGNGGEFSEYAASVKNDSTPMPGVFDATQLQPRLTRAETLPRRAVKHDEINTVHALSDVRIDPDWRTDTKAASHVWYCRDMAADRDNCQLRGLTQPIANSKPSASNMDSYWPSESSGEEDKLPGGTPLFLPANAMQDDKVYTFTLLSLKSKRESLPDMAMLSTANETCPTAVIEPIRGRANVQFMFRIYGQGASSLGDVQFKWNLVDTQPLSAPSMSSNGATTQWLDKAYFSVAKDTMVAGREYKLTLSVRVAGAPAGSCEGTAEHIVLTNVEPRALDGISFTPALGGAVQVDPRLTLLGFDA